MSAHTPGPWTYQEQAGSFFINSPKRYSLATTSDEANARLIAAAPELLEALETVIDAAFAGRPTYQVPSFMYASLEKARAVIQAAKETQ
jgi:hypothetical protein